MLVTMLGSTVEMPTFTAREVGHTYDLPPAVAADYIRAGLARAADPSAVTWEVADLPPAVTPETPAAPAVGPRGRPRARRGE